MKMNFPRCQPRRQKRQESIATKFHHWSEDPNMIMKFLLFVFLHIHIVQSCTIIAIVSVSPYFGRGVVLHCFSTCPTPMGPIIWRKDGVELYRQKDGGKFGWYNVTNQSKRNNTRYDIYKSFDPKRYLQLFL